MGSDPVIHKSAKGTTLSRVHVNGHNSMAERLHEALRIRDGCQSRLIKSVYEDMKTADINVRPQCRLVGNAGWRSACLPQGGKAHLGNR